MAQVWYDPESQEFVNDKGKRVSLVELYKDGIDVSRFLDDWKKGHRMFRNTDANVWNHPRKFKSATKRIEEYIMPIKER